MFHKEEPAPPAVEWHRPKVGLFSLREVRALRVLLPLDRTIPTIECDPGTLLIFLPVQRAFEALECFIQVLNLVAVFSDNHHDTKPRHFETATIRGDFGKRHRGILA